MRRAPSLTAARSGADATRTLIRHDGDALCAWKGPALLIVSLHGEAGTPHPLTGFYCREARFLNTIRPEIDGQRLSPCEATTVAADALQFVYTYPEVAVYGGGGSGQSGDTEPRNRKGIPQRGLEVTLTYTVAVDRLTASAVIGNRRRETLNFDFGWVLSADFADLLEAQSGQREQHAAVDASSGQNELHFAYTHRQVPFRTLVSLSGGHWRTARRPR